MKSIDEEFKTLMKLYPMCSTSWLHFSMDPLNHVYRHKSFHTFRMISGSFFWLIGSKCVQMKRWAASQFLKRVIWQNFFIARSDLIECFDHFKIGWWFWKATLAPGAALKFALATFLKVCLKTWKLQNYSTFYQRWICEWTRTITCHIFYLLWVSPSHLLPPSCDT